MPDDSLVVLDSDVIIDYLAGDKKARMVVLDILYNEKNPSTTVVNVSELFRGILHRQWGNARIAQLQSLLDSLFQIEYTQSAAVLIGDLLAQLDKKGTPIGFADTAIAGLCLLNNASLLTNNTKHFSKVPKLDLYK